MKTIRGKTAVVTGAGSGLGRAIALRLAREGADVYLIDINQAAAEEVAVEARLLGVQATASQCDVSDRSQLEEMAGELRDQGEPIDILVNNAGIAWYGPTLAMSGDEWERLLNVNLHAPIHLTRLLLPHLLTRPEAHVVNMASISGWVCSARFAAYHVSKFGLVGFSEALRAEYGRRGIGVTALCPGPVRTNLYSSGVSGKGPAVQLPPRWICASEAAVARKAVRAIRRNRRLVLVTPLAYLLFNVKRFAPWVLDVMNGLWRQAVTLKAAWIKLHHPELGEAEVEAQAMKLVAGERS